MAGDLPVEDFRGIHVPSSHYLPAPALASAFWPRSKFSSTTSKSLDIINKKYTVAYFDFWLDILKMKSIRLSKFSAGFIAAVILGLCENSVAVPMANYHARPRHPLGELGIPDPSESFIPSMMERNPREFLSGDSYPRYDTSARLEHEDAFPMQRPSADSFARPDESDNLRSMEAGYGYDERLMEEGHGTVGGTGGYLPEKYDGFGGEENEIFDTNQRYYDDHRSPSSFGYPGDHDNDRDEILPIHRQNPLFEEHTGHPNIYGSDKFLDDNGYSTDFDDDYKKMEEGIGATARRELYDADRYGYDEENEDVRDRFAQHHLYEGEEVKEDFNDRYAEDDLYDYKDDYDDDFMSQVNNEEYSENSWTNQNPSRKIGYLALLEQAEARGIDVTSKNFKSPGKNLKFEEKAAFNEHEAIPRARSSRSRPSSVESQFYDDIGRGRRVRSHSRTPSDRSTARSPSAHRYSMVRHEDQPPAQHNTKASIELPEEAEKPEGYLGMAQEEQSTKSSEKSIPSEIEPKSSEPAVSEVAKEKPTPEVKDAKDETFISMISDMLTKRCAGLHLSAKDTMGILTTRPMKLLHFCSNSFKDN